MTYTPPTNLDFLRYASLDQLKREEFINQRVQTFAGELFGLLDPSLDLELNYASDRVATLQPKVSGESYMCIRVESPSSFVVKPHIFPYLKVTLRSSRKSDILMNESDPGFDIDLVYQRALEFGRLVRAEEDDRQLLRVAQKQLKGTPATVLTLQQMFDVPVVTVKVSLSIDDIEDFADFLRNKAAEKLEGAS